MELVDLVNSVMEVTADVIRDHKGQTLKFMGDGLMAIFSALGSSFQRSSFSENEKRETDREAACMCRRARMAAVEVQKRLAALKEEREQKGLRGASVGVGLHYGNVSYGNVGAPERLDFTVLGPHVNLAARTESLCSKLGAKVLCTADFFDLDGDVDVWSSRGAHVVKGVVDPVQIYELTSVHEG
jgi:adenylate cyclase